ncbi:glycosyltransferase [Leptothoe kymatousa]|uniref:Glycosyltransferase n=1 Tax=Leptothoe kymatousa TAU-MAC 1615 TaxID=2364775 RepID=A0ABS5Y3W9_9CYAN|nr:glycosyltransferase [Leptothoe kymatousa]MBT9312515.1 glycosyltransferase [Leptothoe kymatousa TAU-MAC 1615]
MPRILIYRDQLLPYSETFIPAQVESLCHYEAFYGGSRRLNSILNQQETVVFDELSQFSRLWKGLYKVGGIVSPRWLTALRDYNPALVHAHFGSDGGLVAPICKRLNIPLVVTFHGYDATCKTPQWTSVRNQGDFFRTLILHKRDQALNQAHRIVAVSEFIRHQLLQRGAAAEKVLVHYIGIDRQRFSPTPMQRRPIVLFVGRLVEKKGVQYLIQAMAQVQRQHPGVELVIIGKGGMQPRLQNLANKLAVQVQFLGQQPPEQVHHWMNRAQIFCGPSIVAKSGDTEGFGMVFAEAQAMGLPVVSFATGGIPEAVIQGETGLLGPEKDTAQLAKNIRRLLEDGALRDKFARAGQAHVAKNFDLHRNTRQLETVYDQVLSQHAAQASGQ